MTSPSSIADDRFPDLAETVCAIAEEAGRIIMEIYRAGFEVTEKHDNTPVTEADHAAEAVILPRLAALTPDVPVISEEAAAKGELPTGVGATFWAVDPLDGTREFIRRSDEFSINIGLIRDGAPVFGVLHGPAMHVTYYTPARGRAACTKAGAPAVVIQARAVPEEGLTVVGSRSHGSSRKAAAYLADKKVARTLVMGSALKFGLLSEGVADLYPRFGPTSEWDTAAGHALLDAAGGRVETTDGCPLAYGKNKYLNPGFIAWGRSAQTTA